MKYLTGLAVTFLIGAGCRYFDIPAPSPTMLRGALLVVAMTFGYAWTDHVLRRTGSPATTNELCGEPTGRATSVVSDPANP